jgi:sugar lactone lactonase YvrE
VTQPQGLQAFACGDIFVGATQLNNPDDDHAGRGRIFQYDSALNLKGVLWVGGTTHLVYGLNFAPDGVLWAFDPWAWIAVRVAPDGKQLPNRQFAQRPFSKAHFEAGGTLLLTEAVDGDNQPLPLTTRHPVLPGETTKLGDGDIYRFDMDGNLLQVFDPEVHGGMSGSMAITHSVLSADGCSLIYVSETGSRLMRYDLVADRQLPDIRSYAAGEREMYFDLAAISGERLLICMGNRLDLLTEDGEGLRSYPLEGFGWSTLALSPDEAFVYVGNWFTGELVKVDLGAGRVEAATPVAEKCMAGIAVFPG